MGPGSAIASPDSIEGYSHEHLHQIADLMQSYRDRMLALWHEAIRETPQLQPREDLPAEGGNAEVLDRFYEVVRQEILTPESYASLKTYIESSGTLHFTPDAACRLQLALKRALLQLLDETLDQSSESALVTGKSLRLTARRTMDEILLRLAEFYHNARYERVRQEEGRRSRGLKTAQDRLQTLLETMNEGFTAVSASGTTTLFNRRMEEITGFSRDEVINRHISCIYPPEAHDRLLSHLARRKQGEASSYEIEIQHKDGGRIPVRISGAPLRDDYGHYFGSFAVITDITAQVMAENELRQRNEQISRLLETQSRRVAYLATISQVAQIALTTLDPNEIFHRVVEAIQHHFDYNHTSLFLLDEDRDDMVLRARSGDYEPYFEEGYRQPVGTGIVGHVMVDGISIVANNVREEQRRIIAFPEEEATQAELCVPIRMGERVMGALDVQSRHAGTFDDNDQSALETLADQISWVIHNARLYQEARHLKEFNEQVLESIPLPVLLLTEDGNIVYANPAYLSRHDLDADAIVNRTVASVLPDSALALPEAKAGMARVFETGEPVLLERIPGRKLEYTNRIVNLLINRVAVEDGASLALAVVEDITEAVEKSYQSSLLRQIGQTMQGILDLDRLLYAILTSVTAGTALGFNRAILLLVDHEQNLLEGKMGVGPASREAAGRIWSELATQNPSVDDILQDYDRMEDPGDTPLSRAAKQIRLPMVEEVQSGNVLVRSLQERRPITVENEDDTPLDLALWAALGTHHFVAVPLVSRDRSIGVIVADNLYSGQPIAPDSVDLLSAFAGHAALAIENAELYRQLEGKVVEVEEAYVKLEHTQEELVQSERLAVIGEMSARMAHEIRNPLTTIGGFARSLLRKPDPDRVRRASQIMVEEVERLEKLLAETLSFTRPAQPQFEKCDINLICADVGDMLLERLHEIGVEYGQDLADDLPEVELDPDQFRQILINLTQNAIQAMPEGGALSMSTRLAGDEGRPHVEVEVGDTGEGIEKDDLDEVFSPFFTTKTYGTGLGLAISRQIVQDHQGELAIRSSEGEGTAVLVRIPVSHTTVPHPQP